MAEEDHIAKKLKEEAASDRQTGKERFRSKLDEVEAEFQVSTSAAFRQAGSSSKMEGEENILDRGSFVLRMETTVGQDVRYFYPPRLPFDSSVADALQNVHLLIEDRPNVIAVFGGPKSVGKKWMNRTAVVIVVEKKGGVPEKDFFPEKFYGATTDVIEGRTEMLSGLADYHSVFDNPRNSLWGGGSIAVESSPPGTLGMFCRRGEQIVGITCAHVVRKQGLDVYHPAPADLTAYSDLIKRIHGETQSPSVFAKVAYCAETECNDPGPVVTADIAILDVAEDRRKDVHAGFGSGMIEPVAKMISLSDIGNNRVRFVEKFGRKTGSTKGELLCVYPNVLRGKVVESNGTSVLINRSNDSSKEFDFANIHREKETVWFRNQILIQNVDDRTGEMKPFALPGDSGSIVVTRTSNNSVAAVGQVFMILFTESGTYHFTVATPLEPIFKKFDLDFLGDEPSSSSTN